LTTRRVRVFIIALLLCSTASFAARTLPIVSYPKYQIPTALSRTLWVQLGSTVNDAIAAAVASGATSELKWVVMAGPGVSRTYTPNAAVDVMFLADLGTLNGVTSSAAELNVLDGIAATLTASELSILDGVTRTAAQINGPPNVYTVAASGGDHTSVAAAVTAAVTAGASWSNEYRIDYCGCCCARRIR
jgi:hypothetical protein